MRYNLLKKLLCAGLISGSLLIGSFAEAGVVTDRLPLQCYCDHQVNTYNSPGAAKRAGYISANVDMIKILEVRGDGWCRGSYPGSGGKTVTRWFRITDVCADAGYTNRSANVRGNQTVYRTRSGGATIGSVSNNESVIVVADNGSRAQIVYRLDNGTGYKMGWVPSSAVTPAVQSYNPQGNFDAVVSNNPNQITVTGWAADRDNMGESLRVHIYVGGAWNSGAEGYEIVANKSRPDVRQYFTNQGVPAGEYYGFYEKINVKRTGNQPIYAYAINIGGGGNMEIGHLTVDIRGATVGTNNTVRTLPDGWYQISPTHDLRRVLDVNGSSSASGANVMMYTLHGGNNQKFYLQNRGNGWFSLKDGHCDNYITADGNGVGANISSRPWTGSDNQMFKLIDGGGGSYHVIAKVNQNLNFDCAGGWKQDETNVQLWTKENNSAHHKWKFTNTSAPSVPAPAPVQQERDGWIKTNGANVNFRSGPSTGTTSYGKIANGTQLKVLEHNNPNGWSKINYNGRIGYVASQYVSLDKPIINNRQQAMADMARRYIGSKEYNNYCQRFVKVVGQGIGLPAGSAGSALEACNKWCVSSDKNIPLGAAVYLRSKNRSSAGYKYGHVGIYVGNGNVIHALATVREQSLDSLLQKYDYLGWGWQAGVDLR